MDDKFRNQLLHEARTPEALAELGLIYWANVAKRNVSGATILSLLTNYLAIIANDVVRDTRENRIHLCEQIHATMVARIVTARYPESTVPATKRDRSKLQVVKSLDTELEPKV